MRAFVTAATLIAGVFLINCSPAVSLEREDRAFLTPSEMRTYHACLFEAWIEDYCRANAGRWSPDFDRVFPTCVAANGGGKFPLVGVGHWYNVDDYCWNAARGLPR